MVDGSAVAEETLRVRHSVREKRAASATLASGRFSAERYNLAGAYRRAVRAGTLNAAASENLQLVREKATTAARK